MLAFKIGLIIIMIYVIHKENHDLKRLENQRKKMEGKENE